MAVPNIFANATTQIPLVKLDQNFATNITIGTTQVGLGNTAASLAGLSNVTSNLLMSGHVWQTSRNAYTNFASVTPTGTTSASTVQMGLGGTWTITPAFSGRVRLKVMGWCTSNTINTNAVINATYGTGTAPINGAAKTGTFFSSADIIATAAVAGSPGIPFCFEYEATGLTVSTAYWFDPTLTSNGTAQASLHITGVIIEEF